MVSESKMAAQQRAATCHNCVQALFLCVLSSVTTLRASSGVLVSLRTVAFVTFMLFSVSVPVLSEQRTLILPSVSTVLRLLQRTLCFFIAWAMMVRDVVTAIGRPKSQ